MNNDDEKTQDADTKPTPAYDELFAKAQEAVTALRSAPRPGGPIRPGEMLNLKHGLKSELLIEQPDIAAWHEEQVKLISVDLGGDSQLTHLQRASIREVARLEVLLASMGQELLAAGVLSGKGRPRAMTTLYLTVLDRFVKLSATLGLERRAKRVQALHEVLDGK